MKRIKATLAASGILIAGGVTGGLIAASSASASIPDPEPVLVSQQYILPGNSTIVGSAVCAPGYEMISGGYMIPTSGSAVVTAYYNYPNPSGNRWDAGFKNNAAGDRLVTIFALCATLD